MHHDSAAIGTGGAGPAMDFHPDLRAGRQPRGVPIGPLGYRLVQTLSRIGSRRAPAGGSIVQVDDHAAVRLFEPRDPTGAAVLWIHGGGYVIGSAAMSDGWCRRLAAELGAVVAAVEYRLAPQHPFPAPLEDCYAALRWLADRPGIDRVAIGGDSAGGGLAAALALLARDRGEVQPVFQALSYPMLDDRSALRTDVDPASLRMWSVRNNRFAWRAYLGAAVDDPPAQAVPGRREDLAGLAPAWIGVGTRDLFHDEDLAYAERLRTAGVPCDLHVVPGAYHGFDLVETKAAVTLDYRGIQVAALKRALRV
jgi:acetyl esterase/lipase